MRKLSPLGAGTRDNPITLATSPTGWACEAQHWLSTGSALAQYRDPFQRRVEGTRFPALIALQLHTKGEKLALAGQRQKTVPDLQGRRIGCQLAPAFREALILAL
jgi:hypothetical protein